MAEANRLATRGFVNFPTDRAGTGEPGTFVRLVVIEREEEPPDGWGDDPEIWNAFVDRIDRRWGLVNGVGFTVPMGETFIGDDRHGMYAGESYHYPDIDAERTPNPDPGRLRDRRFDSIDYLAVVTLGSARWAPMDGWACTVDDLTDEGKALYRSLESLYPGCRLILQTWLDT